MSSIRVNKIIPHTLGLVTIQGNINVTGDINGMSASALTGITASTIVTTPRTINQDIIVDTDTNALIIGPDVKLASGRKMKIGKNSRLYVYNPNTRSALPTATMVYATSWQRSSSDFEFAFNTFRWTTVRNPDTGSKLYSTNINPKTNNSYIDDYSFKMGEIVAGERVAWMDEDTSQYYDWEYTFFNPVTQVPEVWEPRGLVLTNVAGIPAWDSTNLYNVGDRVRYQWLPSITEPTPESTFPNLMIYECIASNTNQDPLNSSGYWENTGIPAPNPLGPNTPFGPKYVPPVYNGYAFNFWANPSDLVSQYNFKYGSLESGLKDWCYEPSRSAEPYIEGKSPIVTLNVNFDPYNNYNSNQRYPTQFDVQHQMNLLDYINSGFGVVPNPYKKVDLINLGGNMYYRQGCDAVICLDANCTGPFTYHYAGGFSYGKAMSEYVKSIRQNSEPITANAKIIMQGVVKGVIQSRHGNWVFKYNDPNNVSEGFIHGFYQNQLNNPSIVDFDIISLQTGINNGEMDVNFFITCKNSASSYPFPWSFWMGAQVYMKMKDSIVDCKTALSIYGRQNTIKYWHRYVCRTIGTPPAKYTLNEANYSWATQTGVFVAMVLTITDSDFTGFQFNSILDYSDCVVNLLYHTTSTFGPNTTDVMDYTSIGWMYRNIFVPYIKKSNSVTSYTRILNISGSGFSSPNYGYGASDGCIGIYVHSKTGFDNKHVIILCNYKGKKTDSIDIDASQLIRTSWRNVKFKKYYTPLDIYDPINFYIGTSYFTPLTIPEYTPTSAQILSTPLLPTEYLIITAESGIEVDPFDPINNNQ